MCVALREVTSGTLVTPPLCVATAGTWVAELLCDEEPPDVLDLPSVWAVPQDSEFPSVSAVPCDVPSDSETDQELERVTPEEPPEVCATPTA